MGLTLPGNHPSISNFLRLSWRTKLAANLATTLFVFCAGYFAANQIEKHQERAFSTKALTAITLLITAATSSAIELAYRRKIASTTTDIETGTATERSPLKDNKMSTPESYTRARFKPYWPAWTTLLVFSALQWHDEMQETGKAIWSEHPQIAYAALLAVGATLLTGLVQISYAAGQSVFFKRGAQPTQEAAPAESPESSDSMTDVDLNSSTPSPEADTPLPGGYIYAGGYMYG